MTTGRDARPLGNMDTARRGNYESGSDCVLEYGELRFTFNERDLTERVEQAATKLGFVALASPRGPLNRENPRTETSRGHRRVISDHM